MLALIFPLAKGLSLRLPSPLQYRPPSLQMPYRSGTFIYAADGRWPVSVGYLAAGALRFALFRRSLL
jgi:hypothetical protein